MQAGADAGQKAGAPQPVDVWEVVNLTTLGTGAPRPTPESIARTLDDAATQTRSLRELLTLVHRITFQLALRPNRVSEPAEADPNLPMADAFQAASRGYFRLEEDEALLVDVPVADCRYTNIQVANPWMESLDRPVPWKPGRRWVRRPSGRHPARSAGFRA